MFRRWPSTVLVLRTSRAAASLLERPSATSSATRCSCAVSAAPDATRGTLAPAARSSSSARCRHLLAPTTANAETAADNSARASARRLARRSASPIEQAGASLLEAVAPAAVLDERGLEIGQLPGCERAHAQRKRYVAGLASLQGRLERLTRKRARALAPVGPDARLDQGFQERTQRQQRSDGRAARQLLLELVDCLLISPKREVEQTGSHPAGHREPELRRAGRGFRNAGPAGLLVAAERVDPGAQTERFEPITAHRGADRGLELPSRRHCLRQQAEMDLGDRLEGERVPQQAALAGLMSTCCGRVRRLTSAGELARTEQRGSSLAEQLWRWSRLRRCRAQPLSLRLGIVAVPLQSIPEPGADDQGDCAVGAVRKLRRRSCQLQ